MQLLSWEMITEGPGERTERIAAPGGWLYRTTIFVSRPDGERPALHWRGRGPCTRSGRRATSSVAEGSKPQHVIHGHPRNSEDGEAAHREQD